MTKKEIYEKAKEFIKSCDNTRNEEWYGTDQNVFKRPISEFLNFIGIACYGNIIEKNKLEG